ncbi:pyridoxal phosphate-dependent aminotransferase [Enterococcus ratti]|uniref:Aminotransferase n=1 Tax=Enterococcus ratti TaxID=150033 RepID=A0A1L8WPS1_9ENTE|nr:pyridoxal phosphate-dependent aminotransferase [Enterococcus ratti]OJG83019.1 aspartate aminotransferase [Enterococcus ratti]
MELSERIQHLKPSVTLAAAAKANALKTQGKDILNLTIGEPDFATPENIQEAAIRAIKSGKASYYTPSAGIPELRQAIVDYTKKNYGIQYEASQAIVTDGAKFALYVLFQTILNPKDEVIIPVPYWVSYGEQVKLAQGRPVFVRGKEKNAFKVTVSQLEEVRSTKTKALIINSPSNPTGMIYDKKELQAIGEWAVKNDVLIVADDIYGRLVYNDNEFTPMAAISEAIRKQTIIINGISKTYAMTGWRIGYALGSQEIINGMISIASQSTSNPTAVSQYAAIEALTGTQEAVEEMRNAFAERLNLLYPLVSSLPGVTLNKPQGAFYLFPNVKETLLMCGYENVTKWAEDLLEETGVAVVTGEGFGAPENIRLSYATNLGTLEEAIRKMAYFIESKSQN